MQDEKQQNPLFGYTCASIACLCLIDIVFNATTEYGDFVGDKASSNVSIITMCVATNHESFPPFVIDAWPMQLACRCCYKSLCWCTCLLCWAQPFSSAADSSVCSTDASALCSGCSRPTFCSRLSWAPCARSVV